MSDRLPQILALGTLLMSCVLPSQANAVVGIDQQSQAFVRLRLATDEPLDCNSRQLPVQASAGSYSRRIYDCSNARLDREPYYDELGAVTLQAHDYEDAKLGTILRIYLEGPKQVLSQVEFDQVGNETYVFVPQSMATEPKTTGIPESEPMQLALEEVRKAAISNNLDARIEASRSRSAQLTAEILKGVYAPTVGLDMFFEEREDPVANVIAGAGNGIIDSELWTSNAFLEGELPYGTEYELRFENQRLRTNNTFQQLVPEYSSSLELTVKQPLLKDLWINDKLLDLKVSRRDRSINALEFEERLQEVLERANSAYWTFVAAYKAQEVRQQAVNLALEQMNLVHKGAEIGTRARTEVIAAERSLEARKDDLAQARDDLFRAENQLKLLIAGGPEHEFWNRRLVPAPEDIDMLEQEVPNFAEALENAYRERPEFEQLDKELEKVGLQRRFSFNQGLPQIDLVVQGSLFGLAGAPQDIAGFGGAGATVPSQFDGSYVDNLSNVFSGDFRQIRTGLSISWPVSPWTTAQELERLDQEASRVNLSFQRLKQEVRSEVLNSYNSLHVGRQRIQAARNAVADGEKQLAAELKRFRIGLSSNFLVLTRQEELIDAQVRLVEAVRDYNTALGELQRASATILQESNVSLAPARD